MRLVIIESPYAGDVAVNVEYARRAVRHSLVRREAPIASHLLYTQPGILRDEDTAHRIWGIEAGLAWGRVADATIVYADLGISEGMRQGIAHAITSGRVVEYRMIGAHAPLPCPKCGDPSTEIRSFDDVHHRVGCRNGECLHNGPLSASAIEAIRLYNAEVAQC